jgi:3-oxoacyl-[acyl-carrier protein] reductase
MDLQLNNKSALVAGSSKGIGYAIARLLAAEGCRVAINGRESSTVNRAADQLEKETQAEILPLTGDVTLPEVPGQLVHHVSNRFGSIDFLVTNAAGPPTGKFETFDDLAWQKAVDLSFSSHVRLIRAALPYLRQSACASVVSINSFSARQPIPNLVLSNSVRAATAGLIKSLALELGSSGIRFNTVLPGWTSTQRVIDLLTYRTQVNGTSFEEEAKLVNNEIALGRLAQPEEIASAVVFLLSPAASYITGIILPVDGGVIKGTF